MTMVSAIVLAAGMGTRMKSDLVKVMHPLAGPPMIAWPVAAALEAGVSGCVLVVGHQGDKVRQYFAGRDEITFADQSEPLGTGHAVRCAVPSLPQAARTVLILCGDTPLLTSATLKDMLRAHGASGATVTVMTATFADPFGYGRIVKGADGGSAAWSAGGDPGGASAPVRVRAAADSGARSQPGGKPPHNGGRSLFRDAGDTDRVRTGVRPQ